MTKLELTEKYLKRYKDLYRTKTGKSLSDDEAMEQFQSLVTLVNAVYKLMPYLGAERPS